ncbi:MAG: hypothetical protein M1484_03035 [Patescibacteria group bacterium]|nr:hypothetical protein [Patescibacteria group bacterium]MCL5432047.1 hypothetical protein [Patescibacteria group bacterium]
MDDDNVVNVPDFCKKPQMRRLARQSIHPELSYFVGRSIKPVDPVVHDLAKENNIDMFAEIAEDRCDRVFLFSALLAANHPKIQTTLQESRKAMGIINLWAYVKECDSEGGYYDRSLVNLKEPLANKVEEQLNILFNGVCKNLAWEDWKRCIKVWLLTGTLPLPLIPAYPFELFPAQSKETVPWLNSCPAIVIKRRLRERELDPLLEFIRSSELELVKLTANLPDEPIKRKDIDITKLAIGLWIIRLNLQTNADVDKWVTLQEKKDENYFGKRGAPSFPEFPRIKKDAMFYLDKLYPLLASSK